MKRELDELRRAIYDEPVPPRRRRSRRGYAADEEPEGLFKPPQRPTGLLDRSPLTDPLAQVAPLRREHRGPTPGGHGEPRDHGESRDRGELRDYGGRRESRLEFRPFEIVQIRHKFHATQRHFARMFGISLGTLRNWEQGKRRPQGAARALLRVAKANPETVARTLWRYRRVWWMD